MEIEAIQEGGIERWSRERGESVAVVAGLKRRRERKEKPFGHARLRGGVRCPLAADHVGI
jgi:hypothetical protein